MQTFTYPTLTHCINQTYKREGLNGFFRGISPQLCMAAFFKSASFSFYSQAKHLVQPHVCTQYTVLNLSVSSFIAGGISGLCTGILSQPLELIKVVRQLQSLIHIPTSMTTAALSPIAPRRLSTYGIATELVRVRGPFGLFFGFGSHLLRDTLGGAVYFSSYETAKSVLLSQTATNKSTFFQVPPILVHIASGSICGVFAWTVIFPTDCIKSTIQRHALSNHVPYKSVFACAKVLYRQDGLKAFYRGISATWVRAAPLHALNWAVYESVLKLCTAKQFH